MHHEVPAAGRVVGRGEADAQRGRDVGARRVDVDQRHLDPGDPGQQPGHAAADHPGADDRDPVADAAGRRPRAR